MVNDKIRQLANFLRLAAIVKVFKMTETGVALRNADQHRALFHRFTRHGRIAGDYRQRAGGGDPKGVHRF